MKPEIPQSHPYFLTARLFPFAKKQNQIALPDQQVHRLGVLYSSYRFVVSMFLFMASYAVLFKNQAGITQLPSFLQQSVLLFYCLFSLLLLAFFLIAKTQLRRELLVGLLIDVLFISLMLFINGVADIQLVILYIVVVFVSFMLLLSYQAIIITMLSVISVIYNQSYQALTSNFDIFNFAESLLLSLSFLCVGYLSWSISQRLALVEKIAAENAQKNEQLNVINQEVISKLEQGILVLDANLSIILSNESVSTLLSIEMNDSEKDLLNKGLFGKKTKKHKRYFKGGVNRKSNIKVQAVDRNLELESLMTKKHMRLLERIGDSHSNIKSDFLYHYTHNHVVEKIRLTTLPMKDGITLVMMEDLKREQTNAQQLKLASLGQLTASIAHEIRNPLAAISQASELLMEEVNEIHTSIKTDVTEYADGTPVTKTAQDFNPNSELYTMIFNQTKRVNRIIEDVLKLSRQAKPEQSRLPLFVWIKEFLNNHYADKPVLFIENTFTTNNEVYVFFDPHQLEQVLINLINNGLRFSNKVNEQGLVEIVIQCKDNNVMVDVLDSGAGIDEDKIDNLFMPFFTTDNEGTGLGLYLSQAFAEANFARLLYNSNHKKTCFRLSLPNAN